MKKLNKYKLMFLLLFASCFTTLTQAWDWKDVNPANKIRGWYKSVSDIKAFEKFNNYWNENKSNKAKVIVGSAAVVATPFLIWFGVQKYRKNKKEATVE